MQRICIPDWEYQERIKKAAQLVAEKGLDAMLVVSTESDYANARYFSGFWPLFERAGVLIGANGKAVLLVGPESAIFAKDFGKIDKVMVLKEALRIPRRFHKLLFVQYQPFEVRLRQALTL